MTEENAVHLAPIGSWRATQSWVSLAALGARAPWTASRAMIFAAAIGWTAQPVT